MVYNTSSGCRSMPHPELDDLDEEDHLTLRSKYRTWDGPGTGSVRCVKQARGTSGSLIKTRPRNQQKADYSYLPYQSSACMRYLGDEAYIPSKSCPREDIGRSVKSESFLLDKNGKSFKSIEALERSNLDGVKAGPISAKEALKNTEPETEEKRESLSVKGQGRGPTKGDKLAIIRDLLTGHVGKAKCSGIRQNEAASTDGVDINDNRYREESEKREEKLCRDQTRVKELRCAMEHEEEEKASLEMIDRENNSLPGHSEIGSLDRKLAFESGQFGGTVPVYGSFSLPATVDDDPEDANILSDKERMYEEEKEEAEVADKYRHKEKPYPGSDGDQDTGEITLMSAGDGQGETTLVSDAGSSLESSGYQQEGLWNEEPVLTDNTDTDDEGEEEEENSQDRQLSARSCCLLKDDVIDTEGIIERLEKSLATVIANTIDCNKDFIQLKRLLGWMETSVCSYSTSAESPGTKLLIVTENKSTDSFYGLRVDNMYTTYTSVMTRHNTWTDWYTNTNGTDWYRNTRGTDWFTSTRGTDWYTNTLTPMPGWPAVFSWEPDRYRWDRRRRHSQGTGSYREAGLPHKRNQGRQLQCLQGQCCGRQYASSSPPSRQPFDPGRGNGSSRRNNRDDGERGRNNSAQDDWNNNGRRGDEEMPLPERGSLTGPIDATAPSADWRYRKKHNPMSDLDWAEYLGGLSILCKTAEGPVLSICHEQVLKCLATCLESPDELTDDMLNCIVCTSINTMLKHFAVCPSHFNQCAADMCVQIFSLTCSHAYRCLKSQPVVGHAGNQSSSRCPIKLCQRIGQFVAEEDFASRLRGLWLWLKKVLARALGEDIPTAPIESEESLGQRTSSRISSVYNPRLTSIPEDSSTGSSPGSSRVLARKISSLTKVREKSPEAASDDEATPEREDTTRGETTQGSHVEVYNSEDPDSSLRLRSVLATPDKRHQSMPFTNKPKTPAEQYTSFIDHITGEPGIGEVVYGDRNRVVAVARHWADLKVRYHDKLPRNFKEEGVILSEYKHNLCIKSFRYQIEFQWVKVSHLGNGMTGKCHLATDFETDFQFCVKEIHISNYEQLEIELWSDLDHPKIVKFYGAIRVGQNVYILSEFVGGGCLTEAINTQKDLNQRLSQNTALTYFKQILEFLVYLKSKDMLHEDLKSDNILLCRDSVGVKVVDFGLARRLNRSSVPRGTKPFGTQTQWSPEKAESKGYGHPAEVWAAVCVLVHMLSGYPPWVRRFEQYNILHVVIVEKSPPIEDIPNNILEPVRHLIELGFTLSPTERPTADELLQHRAFNTLREQSVSNNLYSVLPSVGPTIHQQNNQTNQLAKPSQELEEVLGSLGPRHSLPGHQEIFLPPVISGSSLSSNVSVPQPLTQRPQGRNSRGEPGTRALADNQSALPLSSLPRHQSVIVSGNQSSVRSRQSYSPLQHYVDFFKDNQLVDFPGAQSQQTLTSYSLSRSSAVGSSATNIQDLEVAAHSNILPRFDLLEGFRADTDQEEQLESEEEDIFRNFDLDVALQELGFKDKDDVQQRDNADNPVDARDKDRGEENNDKNGVKEPSIEPEQGEMTQSARQPHEGEGYRVAGLGHLSPVQRTSFHVDEIFLSDELFGAGSVTTTTTLSARTKELPSSGHDELFGTGDSAFSPASVPSLKGTEASTAKPSSQPGEKDEDTSRPRLRGSGHSAATAAVQDELLEHYTVSTASSLQPSAIDGHNRAGLTQQSSGVHVYGGQTGVFDSHSDYVLPSPLRSLDADHRMSQTARMSRKQNKDAENQRLKSERQSGGDDAMFTNMPFISILQSSASPQPAETTWPATTSPLETTLSPPSGLRLSGGNRTPLMLDVRRKEQKSPTYPGSRSAPVKTPEPPRYQRQTTDIHPHPHTPQSQYHHHHPTDGNSHSPQSAGKPSPSMSVTQDDAFKELIKLEDSLSHHSDSQLHLSQLYQEDVLEPEDVFELDENMDYRTIASLQPYLNLEEDAGVTYTFRHQQADEPLKMYFSGEWLTKTWGELVRQELNQLFGWCQLPRFVLRLNGQTLDLDERVGQTDMEILVEAADDSDDWWVEAGMLSHLG